jgi:hypothetical protein
MSLRILDVSGWQPGGCQVADPLAETFEGTVFLLAVGVEDNVNFILFFSYDGNEGGLVILGLRRQKVIGAGLELANVEDRTDFHEVRLVEFIGRRPTSLRMLNGPMNFLSIFWYGRWVVTCSRDK